MTAHRSRRTVFPLRWMAALWWLIVPLCSCSTPEASKHEFTRLMMGVETRIVIYHEDSHHAEAAATRAFERIAELDLILSDYQIDSELNRLCDAAGGRPVPVSAHLFDALALSERTSRASEGAFDITVGPVTRLWREARRTGVAPTRAAIDEAMGRVGWRRVVLDQAARTATLEVSGMRLDVGGIGKGFAAQEAMEVLRNSGCRRAMVALAGDIVVGDPRPEQSGWTIAVDAGVEGIGSTVELRNQAISTSGDAEQHVVLNGVRYSHIVDPRTGWALRDSIAVTVIAADGATADALATAICVLGEDAGKSLVAKFPGTMMRVHQRPRVTTATMRQP